MGGARKITEIVGFRGFQKMYYASILEIFVKIFEKSMIFLKIYFQLSKKFPKLNNRAFFNKAVQPGKSNRDK